MHNHVSSCQLRFGALKPSLTWSMHFNLVHALVDMSSKGLLLGCCSIGVGAGRPKFVVVWWRGGVPAQSRRGAGQLQVYDSSCFVIVAWWYERATSSRREGQPGLAARPHDGDRDEREKRRDREIAICIKRARSLLLNDAHHCLVVAARQAG